MGKRATLIVLAGTALLGILGIPSTVRSQPSAAETSPPLAYTDNCSSCHGAGLGGGLGPALSGNDFKGKWSRLGTTALQDKILNTMPPSGPGSLAAEDYDAIIDYIRSRNGLEAVVGTLDRTLSSSPDAPLGWDPDASMTGGRSGTGKAYDEVIAGRMQRLAAMRPVTDRMLRQPDDGEWVNWRRTDDGSGYSPLTEINTHNAAGLDLAWALALPAGTNKITPLVHDGVMFVNSRGTVEAIDVANGDILWSFTRPLPSGPMVNTNPISMAVYGERVFVQTLDKHVIALNFRNGARLWDTALQGTKPGMRLNGSLMVVHGKVIFGTSGCGLTGGCFIAALDAQNGNELWRFHTIAQAGEPGGDTWNGAAETARAGASVWTGGTYDAELNLIYFGTGQTYNISPLLRSNGERSAGNSGLFTNTTLALNPDTGKLVWHYQHLARDVWDFDWVFERIVARLNIRGKPHKVVMTMGKLGILDVLDAATGRYLTSYDTGMQNLVTAIDKKTGWKTTNPAFEPLPQQNLFMCPYSGGVRNWPPTSFDPRTGILYVPMGLACMKFRYDPTQKDDQISYFEEPVPNSDGQNGEVLAVDVAEGKAVWQQRYRHPLASGTLTTAGGLLIEGGGDRELRVSDSATGQVLWRKTLDSALSASPVTFSADGHQYIAITAGGGAPYEVSRRHLTPETSTLGTATILWVFKLR